MWLPTIVLGLMAAASYYWLRAHHVGGIGAPTDIGGGGILLLGLVLTAVGLGGTVTTVVRSLLRHRRSGRERRRAGEDVR